MPHVKRVVSKSKVYLVAGILLAAACGRTSEVETIRGPDGKQGERGEKGEKGDPGEVVYTPAPSPTVEPTREPRPEPTATNLPPTYPYPPIIIVNNGQCSRLSCPPNTIVVCACVDNFWQTVSVSPNDVYKLRIKHYGACQPQTPNQGADDCFSWPKPQPQQTPVPVPPVPTKEC